MMALIFRPEISPVTEVKTLVTFYLSALLLFLIRLKRKKLTTKKQTLPLPPGPHGLPILGILPFLNPNLHHYFADLAKSFGPILSLRLGSKLCVVVSSPSFARQILKDQDSAFANHATPAATLLYFRNSNLDLLWSPYGPHWRMLRKIAVHDILSTDVAPLRCREMRSTVKVVCGRAKMGAGVDVRETVFLTVLNMMTSMLWGEQVGGSSEGIEFRRAIEGAVDILMAPNVADFFPVLAQLDPQGLGRRIKKLMVWINKYLGEIVEKKKKKMVGGERRRDVLEALLDLVESGNSQPLFSLDDLCKLLVDLIGGSADTISTAVEWSMAELLSNPKKMRIAQQELDAVVGKHRIVEESDLPHLHYLSAVVKESLRLHPPLPLLIPHCPSTHCVVSGFSVPADTSVFINVWAIHRDPHLWGEDAEEFKPERFLKTSRKKNNFCYLPFGAGRRVCVGTAIGEKTVIYIVASLLHSFEWRLPKGASLELGEKFGAVLRKVEQLFAVPTMRLDSPELYL